MAEDPSAAGAGAGAGAADSEPLLEPPLAPSTAATMKAIATTTRAASSFGVSGIGLRRRRLGFGFGFERRLGALGLRLLGRAVGLCLRPRRRLGLRRFRRRLVGVDRSVGAHRRERYMGARRDRVRLGLRCSDTRRWGLRYSFGDWLTDQSISPLSRKEPDEFRTQRGAARVQGTLPQVCPRGDPPRRAQARRRGEHAVGGRQGGAPPGISGDRGAAALGLGLRGPDDPDLRRRAPLGLRRDRAGDRRLRSRRRRHRRHRHPRADRLLGARVLRQRR